MRPAESTGSTKRSITEYTSIDQTKSGNRIHDMPRARMLWIVTMKLIAPAADEIVRMWIERIHRSCPFPGAITDSGAYAVQPVFAAPPAARNEDRKTRPANA